MQAKKTLIEWGVDFIPKNQPPLSTSLEKISPQKLESSPPLKNTTCETIDDFDEFKKCVLACVRCKLSTTRTQVVFGQGNMKARLMFVGEAPGADEDLQGLAFVGRAGQLLTKMIEAMGITRDEVYIANIVKCRPPQNRNPEPDEIASCSPYLKRQIAVIKPEVIVTLGKFAAQTLLQTEIPITKLRGQFSTYENVALMPTYHPAFLLRNPSMKKVVWDDLKKVMDKLGLPAK